MALPLVRMPSSPGQAGSPPVTRSQLYPLPHFAANPFALTNRKSVKGEFVRATERTKTAGDFKARFFQDLLQGGSLPGLFMMMRVSYDGDMYPSLPGGFKSLDWLVSLSLLVKMIGVRLTRTVCDNRRIYSQAFRASEASGLEAD